MKTLIYYWHSFVGYWPTARALTPSVFESLILFIVLLSVPVRKRLFGMHPKRLNLYIGSRWTPYFVRDGNDISALREVFAGDEYAFDLPTLAPRHIADIGAHIGASALYFHAVYPDARITAYEPDPDTFALLQRNTASLEKCECVQAAVTDRKGETTFYPSTGGSTRSSTKHIPDAGEAMRVTTVDFADVAGRGVDFVKFDSEGSEYDMFSSARIEDIRKIDRYVGEVHHYLIHKTQAEFEALFPGFTSVWKDRGPNISIVALSRA